LTATDISSGISASLDLTVGAPTSVDDVLGEAVGGPTRVEDLQASVSLAGDQIVYENSDIVVSTDEPTKMTIRVDTNALKVTFEPFLALTACKGGLCLDGIVLLESLYFNYHEQKVGGSWQAPAAVEWWSGVGPTLTAKVNSNLLSALPKQMLAPGYNPFEDQELPGQLSGILAKIRSSASGGGGSAGGMQDEIQSSDAKLHADICLTGELRDDPIAIPAGTSFSLDVILDGGMPASLADAKIACVILRSVGGGAGAKVKYMLAGMDLPAVFVRKAVLHYGGSITTDYTVSSEAIETIARMAFGAVRFAAGEQVDDSDLDGREPKVRAKLDEVVHSKLEPQLKNLIIRHKDVVPGLDLAKALGL
jgi:hypothetical protein